MTQPIVAAAEDFRKLQEEIDVMRERREKVSDELSRLVVRIEEKSAMRDEAKQYLLGLALGIEYKRKGDGK